jgi:hypothetical protein
LPAVLCVFHAFIANHGEFRLAVPKILKNNHVARIVYGLMFDSILRRLNPVSLRRFAYVAVSLSSQDAMLFTDNAAQLGPQPPSKRPKLLSLDAEQATSIANAVGMSR